MALFVIPIKIWHVYILFLGICLDNRSEADFVPGLADRDNASFHQASFERLVRPPR